MPHLYLAIIQIQYVNIFHFLVPQSNHTAAPASKQRTDVQCSQLNDMCFNSPVTREFMILVFFGDPLLKTAKQETSDN